jgi:hypothetical protein
MIKIQSVYPKYHQPLRNCSIILNWYLEFVWNSGFVI